MLKTTTVPRFLPLILILISNSIVCGKKQVTVSLDAKWPHTSYVAETSEFLARKSDETFFQFLEKLIAWRRANPVKNESSSKGEEATTQLQEYDLALRQSAPLLRGDAEANLLKFALSLRIYSPRVQVHQQIAGGYAESSKCDSFIDVNGRVICSAEEFDAVIGGDSLQPIYSIDHVHHWSANESGKPTAILYGNVDMPEQFQHNHAKLKEAVREGRLGVYIFRHFKRGVVSGRGEAGKGGVGLSGYAVELAIKNTEYKAVDDSNVVKEREDGEETENENMETDIQGFNFPKLRKLHEHLKPALQQFKIHLAESEELSPLKQWEVADISYQAAQRIVDSSPEEALATLIDISQNFPIRARGLAQTKVKKAFREEVQLNQKRFTDELELSEGDNALYLNGIHVDVETLDSFQLFNMVQDEEALANAFFQMGFRREYLSVLYNMDVADGEKTAYALDYRDAYPDYINDLDKDKHYREWGNSVKLLLQPYFPGMMRPIARNLFTLVVIFDPAARESHNLLKIAHSLFVHRVPLRLGFVFVVEDESKSGMEDAGVALLNLYNFAKADRSPAKAIHLLTKLMDEQWGVGSVDDEEPVIQATTVHRFFRKHFPDQAVEDVFAADSDYDVGKKTGRAFFQRSGLQWLPKVLLNGVVLDDSALLADKIEEAVLMQVMRQTPNFQRAVISGKLTDRENVQNWVMSQPDVLPRLNGRLLGEPQIHLPLFDVNPCGARTPKEFKSTLKPEQRAQCILEKAIYVAKSDEGDPSTKWLNIWLAGDLDAASPAGRLLLANALKALKKSSNMRISLLHSGTHGKEGSSLTRLVQSIERRVPSTVAKQMLNKLLSSDEVAMHVKTTGSLEKIAVHVSVAHE